MKENLSFALVVSLILLSGCIGQPEGGEKMLEVKGKKALLIVAPSNFRDEELFKTKAELEKAGATTTIASREKGTITGMLGGKAEATLSLGEANVAEFDAVVFIGGSGAATYFNDSTAQQIAREAAEKEKVLAAICIAPSILANAGLLQGKNATSFSSEADNLQNKGANYTGEAVTVDGKIVTGNGPEAAQQFGQKIVEALAG